MKPLELILLIIVVFVDVGLALTVLLRNPRSRANRLLSATALAMVVWLVANFMCDQPAFYAHALLLNRLAFAAGLVVGIPLIGFAVRFPNSSARFTFEWWGLFFALGALAVMTLFTDSVVESVQIRSWGTNVVQGWVFPYVTMFGLCVLAGLVLTLFLKYRGAEPHLRAQFGYLFMGLGLFAFGAMLLGALLPALSGANQLAQLQPFSTVLFLVPTGYAVVKHRLMDIRVVALRAAAYTLLVAIAGLVLLLPAVFARTSLAPRLGLEPNAAFLLAGLAAVLGFQPLKRALDRAGDRFFYRRTFDPDALLRKLGHSMAETLDVHELAERIAENLAIGMKLTFATVSYFHAETPQMVSCGTGPSEGSLRQLVVLSNGGETLVADELASDSEAAAILSDGGARVLVPLIADAELIGTVILGPKRSGGLFSATDMRFIEIMRSEASISMKNAHLFYEKNLRVGELTALNDLAYALGADIELESVLSAAMEQVVSVTAADSGSIMLLNESDMSLSIAASRGVHQDVVAATRSALGEGVAGWVARSREALILVGDTDPRFTDDLKRDSIISAISAPIICKDSVIGVLNVNRHESTDLFTQANLDMVKSFAGQMAVVIENARLYRELENTILGTIEALAAAVDAKDPYTAGHSRDVTDYVVAIAERMHVPASAIRTLRIAATLHDIGKIGINQQILNKPGPLSDEEFEEMRRHPAIGADILGSLEFLKEAVPLILFHHERFGGGGYPSGVSGETIPLGARIISVADAFNAMTSNRTYRDAMPFSHAVAELNAGANTQFDPDVVAAFLEVLTEEKAHQLPGRQAAKLTQAEGY